MRIQQTMQLAFVVAAVQSSAAVAQQLTDEQQGRIEVGMRLIKLGCGTDLSQDRTQVTAGGQGSFTLRKLPGFTAGGQVAYAKADAHGLVANLEREITDNVRSLSQYQIDCMRPYVARIFATIYPDAPAPPAGLGRDGPARPPPPPSPSVIGVRDDRPIQPLVIVPPPNPGPGRRSSAWDGTSAGRWRTQAAPADCHRKYYSWEFTGNEVEYRDQDDQRDREEILNISSDGMSTKTISSLHSNGPGERPGTLWSYKFARNGTIAVTSSTGKSFTLARCPS